jgi:hypothetical protein
VKNMKNSLIPSSKNEKRIIVFAEIDSSNIPYTNGEKLSGINVTVVTRATCETFTLKFFDKIGKRG